MRTPKTLLAESRHLLVHLTEDWEESGHDFKEVDELVDQIDVLLSASPGAIKSYKFRAECVADVAELINNMYPDSDGKWQRITIEPLLFPDIVVTLEATSTVEQIRKIMDRVPDSHVMRETLSEAETYTGERRTVNEEGIENG